MNKVRSNQPVLPSLLDRLIDNDPRNRDSLVSQSYGALLSDIKHSIRRDLESLLNTRVYRSKLPSTLTELESSMVTTVAV